MEVPVMRYVIFVFSPVERRVQKTVFGTSEYGQKETHIGHHHTRAEERWANSVLH